MSDRTINFGESETEATYQIQDTDSTGGGNFVVAKDTNANTVLLQYDPAADTWEYAGDVDMNGGNVSGVGSLTADSVNTEEANISKVLTAVGLDVSNDVNNPTVWVNHSNDPNDIIRAIGNRSLVQTVDGDNEPHIIHDNTATDPEATAATFLVSGRKQGSTDTFLDVVAYVGGGGAEVISSPPPRGSPGTRSYTEGSFNLRLAIDDTGNTYNIAVNYLHATPNDNTPP